MTQRGGNRPALAPGARVRVESRIIASRQVWGVSLDGGGWVPFRDWSAAMGWANFLASNIRTAQSRRLGRPYKERQK